MCNDGACHISFSFTVLRYQSPAEEIWSRCDRYLFSIVHCFNHLLCDAAGRSKTVSCSNSLWCDPRVKGFEYGCMPVWCTPSMIGSKHEWLQARTAPSTNGSMWQPFRVWTVPCPWVHHCPDLLFVLQLVQMMALAHPCTWPLTSVLTGILDITWSEMPFCCWNQFRPCFLHKYAHDLHLMCAWMLAYDVRKEGRKEGANAGRCADIVRCLYCLNHTDIVGIVWCWYRWNCWYNSMLTSWQSLISLVSFEADILEILISFDADIYRIVDIVLFWYLLMPISLKWLISLVSFDADIVDVVKFWYHWYQSYRLMLILLISFDAHVIDKVWCVFCMSTICELSIKTTLWMQNISLSLLDLFMCAGQRKGTNSLTWRYCWWEIGVCVPTSFLFDTLLPFPPFAPWSHYTSSWDLDCSTVIGACTS